MYKSRMGECKICGQRVKNKSGVCNNCEERIAARKSKRKHKEYWAAIKAKIEREKSAEADAIKLFKEMSNPYWASRFCAGE